VAVLGRTLFSDERCSRTNAVLGRTLFSD